MQLLRWPGQGRHPGRPAGGRRVRRRWAHWAAQVSEPSSFTFGAPLPSGPLPCFAQALTRLERLTLSNLASDHGLQHLHSVTQLRCVQLESACPAKWSRCRLRGPVWSIMLMRLRVEASAGCSFCAWSLISPPPPTHPPCRRFLMLNHSYGSPDDTDEEAVAQMDSK